ncbi:cache domain-containing protein [bacterium AH-315-G05]|nr:cache domain-containing protein [bacterium AH-315-G05]
MIKAYRSLFRRRALRVWLIIIFMLIIYIPIVVNIVYIHNQTIEVVRREKKESIQNKLSKVRETINFVTNEIQENSNEFIAHLGIRKSIQDFEKLDEDRQESVRRFIIGKIDDVVEKSGGYIKEAFVITEEGEFFKQVGLELVERSSFVQSWFLWNARRKDSNALWQIISGEKLYENTEQEKNLVLTEKIYDIDEQRVIGIFVVMVENNNFYNLYGNTVSHYSGQSEIYDGRFKPLSLGNVDEKLYLNVYAKQELANHELTNQEQVSMKIGSVDYVIVNEYLDILDWRLVSLVPEEELVLSIKKELRRSLILILLVSAIVAVIIAFEITVVSSASLLNSLYKRQKSTLFLT